jgi:uncharacterized protein involved in exopolysaccharide biosynthesis
MNHNRGGGQQLRALAVRLLGTPPSEQLYGEASVNVLAAFALAWRGRLMILVVAAMACAMGTVLALRESPVYRSSFSLFVKGSAQSTSAVGQFAGISKSLGLDLGGESLAVDIHELAISRRVRHEILSRNWLVSGGGEVSLYKFWGLLDSTSEDTLAQRTVDPKIVEEALERLRLVITVAKRPTELIVVAVDIADPVLAANLAEFLSSFLRSQYIELRQKNARVEREFVAERLTETKLNLNSAEIALAEFIGANQAFRQSATLTQQYSMLQREVDALSQVYLALRPQLEMAKIEEVRQMPLIEVLDHPEIPVTPIRPDRFTMVAVASILGVLIGVVLVFAFAYVRFVRAGVAERGRSS